MAQETLEEAERDQLFTTSQGEVCSFSIGADEIDAVAFKLWRHSQCSNLMTDECQCCKGAAQECFVTCR